MTRWEVCYPSICVYLRFFPKWYIAAFEFFPVPKLRRVVDFVIKVMLFICLPTIRFEWVLSCRLHRNRIFSLVLGSFNGSSAKLAALRNRSSRGTGIGSSELEGISLKSINAVPFRTGLYPGMVGEIRTLVGLLTSRARGPVTLLVN